MQRPQLVIFLITTKNKFNNYVGAALVAALPLKKSKMKKVYYYYGAGALALIAIAVAIWYFFFSPAAVKAAAAKKAAADKAKQNNPPVVKPPVNNNPVVKPPVNNNPVVVTPPVEEDDSNNPAANVNADDLAQELINDISADYQNVNVWTILTNQTLDNFKAVCTAFNNQQGQSIPNILNAHGFFFTPAWEAIRAKILSICTDNGIF